MVLATVDPSGQPSARVVLCKDIDTNLGYLVFYTHYRSRKGAELATNPRAAIVLHMDHLHRQLRVEGSVTQAPPEDSDAYFASRSPESAIGAWASDQSQPIASRRALEQAVARETARLNPAGASKVFIPRPAYWGGYRLWAKTVELWVEGTSRIHDRARWTRELSASSEPFTFNAGPWTATRLQP
jgi:pyridoxamine 5'-phosphate oxidase